jgi:hypothetical protein
MSAAMWNEGFMEFVVLSRRRSAKVAHLTRVFLVWQQEFHAADERHAFPGRAEKRNPPCDGFPFDSNEVRNWIPAQRTSMYWPG